MGDELDDILDDASADDKGLDETAQALAHARPVPVPAFRGALGRLMLAVAIPRPVRHLRAKALLLALCGALLLGLAGAGVAGSGPLAPSHLASSSASTPSVR